MTTPLVLVGAGGLAREVLSSLGRQDAYAVRGVLDDARDLQGTTVGGVLVLGPVEEIRRHPDVELVVCVGQGQHRASIVRRLQVLGVEEDRYATVVDPTVSVGAGCTVGAGSVLLPQVVLTADVRLGRHVVAMPHVTFTHDDRVEDFATLCAGVSLGGDVGLGWAAYLGMHSSVREHTTVGAAAVLGMGAVLLHDLPPGQTWTGVPARAIRRGTSDHYPYPVDCRSVS